MEMSKLLDTNMIGKFTCLPLLMGMGVTDGEVTVINSGISFDMLNIICRAKSKNVHSNLKCIKHW
jgi:hypothetical protein